MTDEPRRPGEWPVPPSGDEPEPQHDRATSERARVEIVMESIKAHLAEQPSEQSIRAVARHWQAAVAQAAEALVTERRARHP